MNEIKQTLQQDADALLKRLQQSRKNGTGVTLGVSDVGVLCEEIDLLKAQQKLNKPARVGGAVFREGVAWKTVIECAQRHYDYGQRDTQPTPLISPSDAIKLASGELVLVPKIANKKMIDSGYEAHDGFFSNGSVRNVWDAMIEAAQGEQNEY